MYPKSVTRKLLQGIDILDVLRHYFDDKLKRRGNNPYEWIMLCPFHTEKTPSFTVTARKQFYHCFGCGAHGNAIRFVEEWEGLDFGDAVKKVCDITNFHIASGKTKPQRARRRSRETLRRVVAEHRRKAQERRQYRNIHVGNAAVWKMEREYRFRRFKKSGSKGAKDTKIANYVPF